LKIKIIINFRTREINQDIHKFTQKSKLIKKIKFLPSIHQWISQQKYPRERVKINLQLSCIERGKNDGKNGLLIVLEKMDIIYEDNK
jgi:hypothetical protein